MSDDSPFSIPRSPADIPADAQPITGAVVLSPAAQRFQSCRWRRPAENGSPECCVHRDVLPMAGTRGFTPDAWCTECAHFKARRAARKRPPVERDSYYY